MKCPQCQNQHPKKQGDTCACGYKFVFMPDADKGMTDGKFLALLRKASSGDIYYYTFSQLYWAWCDTRRRQKFKTTIGCGIFGGIFCLIAFFILTGLKLLLVWILLALIIFGCLVYQIWSHVDPTPVEPDELKDMVKKWAASHGKPEKLLVKPALFAPPPDFAESDIYDYGVERIIIVERRLLVDLLVKNGFHAEHKSLIVSMSGYPAYIQERARQLLLEHPGLPVCLLHDASSKSQAMIGRVTLPIQGHPIHDLGAFAEDFKNLKVLKPLGLKARDFEAPLDVLPYRTLAALAGTAVVSLVPFEQVLAAAAAHDTSHDSSSFG